MHEAALARAALPAPSVILGLPLRPYSLGHELWLIRRDNPFVTPGVDHTPARTREAVMICANDWDSLQKFNRSWLALIALKVWRWRTRDADFALATADFANYRAAGCLDFRYNKPTAGKAARRAGAPFILRLHQWIMEHHRLTYSRAWDFPMGMATMCWAAHCEREGTLEVFNEVDEASETFVRENDALLDALVAQGMDPAKAWEEIGKRLEARNGK